MKRKALLICVLFWQFSHAQFLSNPSSKVDENSQDPLSEEVLVPDSLQLLGQIDSVAILEKRTAQVKDYDHKEQVITAGIFMASIITLMASMNNFNPKR